MTELRAEMLRLLREANRADLTENEDVLQAMELAYLHGGWDGWTANRTPPAPVSVPL